MSRSTYLLLFCLALTLSSISAWEWPSDTAETEIDYCYPDQVHISLGDAYYNSLNNFTQINEKENANNSVYIVWQTQTECANFYVMIESQKKDFILNVTAGQIWNELIDQIIEASWNDAVDAEGNKLEGHYVSYSHTAMVSGLVPGVSYSYQIFQENGTNSAGPFTFVLPEIAPIDGAKPIKFSVFADVDTMRTNTTMKALQRLQAQDANALSFNLFLGDLGYDIFHDNGKRGEYYFNSWQSILASWPFMLTPGNHEIYRNYSFLNVRNRMPIYNKTKNHYFSFNVGKMHILALNYYFYNLENEANREQMFKWMEEDLIAANASRKERPWLVIATHQPIYCSLNDPGDEADKRCYNFFERYKRFEELFYKYRVDIVLQGHVHNWERTGPVYNNKTQSYQSYSESQKKNYIINPLAPIYTIEGAAGNWYFTAGDTPMANYSMNVDNKISYSTLTLVNGSALKYEHINSETGDLMDYFYLLKGDDYLPTPKPSEPTKPSSPWLWIVLGGLVAVVVLLFLAKRYGKKLFSRRTRVDLRIAMMKGKETEILEF